MGQEKTQGNWIGIYYIIQAGDGSTIGGEKGSYSRNILEVKLTEIKCDSALFDIRNWKIELSLPKMKKARRWEHEGEDQDSSSGYGVFEMSIRYAIGVTEKEVE